MQLMKGKQWDTLLVDLWREKLKQKKSKHNKFGDRCVYSRQETHKRNLYVHNKGFLLENQGEF